MRSVLIRAGAGLAVAITVATGWAAPAAAAGPPVQLAVSAPASRYAPGADVPLRFSVTNHRPAACALSAIADGSVTVVTATRDGAALSPSFSRMSPVAGSAAMVARHRKQVVAGGGVTFGGNAGGPLGLSLRTPARDGSVVAATWPTARTGEYRFTLVYQVSPLAGPDVCPGLSNTATVRFEVREPVPVLLIALLAGGAVLLLLLPAVLLLRSRRRAAAAPLLVLLLIAGVLGHPGRARADVSFQAGSSRAASAAYVACVGKITAFDPSVYDTLNAKGSPKVLILIYVTSAEGPLTGGGPRDSLIKWDFEGTGPIPGEAAGVTFDPCAELYHELQHARDRATGKDDDTATCGDTGVPTDEIRATMAENRYRAAHRLPLRTGYGGAALPKSIKDCAPKAPGKPAPGPKKKAGQRCAAAGCGGSTGDPHITTFDGRRYEFQAVGEFSAVESRAGDLGVQVRQTPLPGSTEVSVNSAVAVRAGTARLGFDLDGGEILVRRDGRAVTPGAETDLPGGAVLAHRVDDHTGDVYDVR